MKRISKTCLYVWLFLCVAVGCTQTEVEEKDIPAHALKDVETVFNLHVLANQTSPTRSASVEGDTIQTRATTDLASGQDSKIAGLWIGQYNASGSLLYHYYNGSMTGTTINVKLKQNAAGDNSKSHVWFVTNSGDLGEVVTEVELKQKVLVYSSTEEGLPESGLCGMSGMWEGVVKEESETKAINVSLIRQVAKITFSYTINESPDIFTFTPDSILLKSVPDRLQIDTARTQLANVTYKTYKKIIERNPGSNAVTMYWYLPENMAGTVSGMDVVDAEKKKTGNGVQNATYIEMAGTAVQGGVTYKKVVFRFYPGKDCNNYDIVRNSHYQMTVTLMGIDITDERITVGEIPPIEVSGGNMPAEKGETKEVQITARPGQEWSFNLDSWLSAIIDGHNTVTGGEITYQGPANVTFKSTEANPKTEPRSADFQVNIGGATQTFTITQEGSTLEKGADILLGAASGSEGTSSFTATQGLSLQVDRSIDDWWDFSADWTNPTTAGVSTGGSQYLYIQARTSNPSRNPRSGTITVKVGESVSDVNYTDLKKDIQVTQAGSTVTGSTVTIAAEAAENQSDNFTATPGLDWVASVTDGSWITLTTRFGTPTSTTGQALTYNVTVNPSSSPRSDEITVRSGDETTGPTGIITITQNGSTFTVDKTVIELEKTTESGFVNVKGTGITLDSRTGSNNKRHNSFY